MFSLLQERIIAKLLENRIALYSPHTAIDAAADGLNDWLISAFHSKYRTFIKQKITYNLKTKFVNYISFSN